MWNKADWTVQGLGVSGREDLPPSLVMVGRINSANSIAVGTAIWMTESYHKNSYVNFGLKADSTGASNFLLAGNRSDNGRVTRCPVSWQLQALNL
jgi:hypothetical protein